MENGKEREGKNGIGLEREKNNDVFFSLFATPMLVLLFSSSAAK
jgi:hypothetical protein